MDDQGVPKQLHSRIFNHYQYYWYRCKGKDAKELLYEAPYCLEVEVYDIIFQDMLDSVSVAPMNDGVQLICDVMSAVLYCRSHC